MAGACIICGHPTGACTHPAASAGPRYKPLSLERMEEPPMAAHDHEFVYVDINGNEVSADDPEVQTRYTRRDFKALGTGMVFGAAPKAEKAEAPADVPDAKGADPADAPADDETADTAAPVKHAAKK